MESIRKSINDKKNVESEGRIRLPKNCVKHIQSINRCLLRIRQGGRWLISTCSRKGSQHPSSSHRQLPMMSAMKKALPFLRRCRAAGAGGRETPARFVPRFSLRKCGRGVLLSLYVPVSSNLRIISFRSDCNSSFKILGGALIT